MRTSRLITIFLAMALLVVSFASESFAGTKLYQGSWIAESFGNDKVGIGTKESKYFDVAGIPLGVNCHPNAPLCDMTSTPVTTTGTPNAPGANGVAWNPVGPGCRPLTAGEKPRPAKGHTLTTGNGSCAFTTSSTGTYPYGTQHKTPCNKKPPLYRNVAFFTPTSGLLASNQACSGAEKATGAKATAYLPPGDPQRGLVMKGSPLTGSQSATTNGSSFNFPAAAATPGPENGMFRTAKGSFIGEGPYRYSYTYATLRNDAGDFGPGKGFFATDATQTQITFHNKVGEANVATIKVRPGANKFGGVMKLLGSYKTKVCYFYQGGCGLGYGDWVYELIGASGVKGKSSPSSDVITQEFKTSFVFTYYNTELATIGKYDIVAHRFPWTTGEVTVTATARGANNTFEQRVGFDNRVGGVGTVQLVSPILTEWLSQFGGGEKMETGGIAVMQIKFVPEPGGVASLVAGLSMLWVMRRFRS